MDAITYLRSEHAKFRRTLNIISKTVNERSKKLRFKAFVKDLVRHETMEQKIWYPFLRKNAKLKPVIKHLIAEEKKAAKAIKQLNKKSLAFIWKLKFFKFKHDVDHHAKDEEKKLFPKARRAFTKKELNEIGVKMRKFKSKLKTTKKKV